MQNEQHDPCPLIPGHEVVGTVAAVGDRVTTT
ncbi:MAG: alcohol dehydrogenase catalytic domain-containing protein [Kaiparowitsia implicata GSE-PSE-MK54-09C]|nr:alcohol dehydrogenase catalytic domain-containing protein [Kaiparowitsia implicata GSE-PSE-MK54-09C]